jgi:hypothetical protein
MVNVLAALCVKEKPRLPAVIERPHPMIQSRRTPAWAYSFVTSRISLGSTGAKAAALSRHSTPRLASDRPLDLELSVKLEAC